MTGLTQIYPPYFYPYLFQPLGVLYFAESIISYPGDTVTKTMFQITLRRKKHGRRSATGQESRGKLALSPKT